jgi:hypothetical protein
MASLVQVNLLVSFFFDVCDEADPKAARLESPSGRPGFKTQKRLQDTVEALHIKVLSMRSTGLVDLMKITYSLSSSVHTFNYYALKYVVSMVRPLDGHAWWRSQLEQSRSSRRPFFPSTLCWKRRIRTSSKAWYSSHVSREACEYETPPQARISKESANDFILQSSRFPSPSSSFSKTIFKVTTRNNSNSTVPVNKLLPRRYTLHLLVTPSMI